MAVPPTDGAAFFADARRDLSGPLAGVRVVEVTTTWAGPMAACVLADYGADVIKVEHPDGEVIRRIPPLFPGSTETVVQHSVNRNKRSLALDLHGEAGRDVLRRLVRTADIFIENFRPGALAEWGLGYADLKREKPDLVYVSVSGFGQFGPLAGRAGYDPLAQVMSGWARLNGHPGDPPVKAPTWIADDIGGLHGALGAMAALRHRDRTGEGQHVDIALLDALLFQSNGLLSHGHHGLAEPRLGNRFPFAIPANVYGCADGLDAFVGVLIDAHWARLATVIGAPDLADDPRFARLEQRVQHADEADRLLAAWCARHPREAVLAAMAAQGIAAGPVQSYAEAARHPQVQVRGMLQDVTLPDGSVAAVTAPPAKLSRTPLAVRKAGSTLGADTDAVLADIGIDAAMRAALRADGVIR